MNEHSNDKIFRLIISIGIIIAFVILGIFNKVKEKNIQQSEKNKVVEIEQENVLEKELDSIDVSDQDVIEEKSNKIEEDNDSKQENGVYEENQLTLDDGEIAGVYFENGNTLYDNDEIPLGVYTNQMEKIQEFTNLNYKNPVTKITIDEDSVKVTNNELTYTCDLNNGYLLYVICDLSTYKFSFADSKKYEN